MDKNIIFISLLLISIVILLAPPILTLFFRGRMRIFNRLGDRIQSRIRTAQTNGNTSAEQNINTRTTTIWTAAFIVFTSLLSLAAFNSTHQIVDKMVKPVTVTWFKSDTLKLKPGPVWFYYDNKSGILNTLHVINETEKTQLAGLINNDEKIYQSYSQAIDKLAFESNLPKPSTLYVWLTLLYAVAGLLGVQLRTINNFIGRACYRNFDFHVWWPWYLVRPLVGFITGAVVFLLIDSKQLLAGDSAGGMSALALAAAFLGGFSADEFYELLRKISKRILGS